MQIQIKATNVDLTPPIKEYAEEKIGHLIKFFDKIDQAKVELERDKHHKTGLVMRAEVMLFVGSKIMRAEAFSEDMYASIDLVVPKLKEQISKLKDKKTSVAKRSARAAKRTR